MELLFGRTPDDVYAAKGVKPTLSPNLDTLALVEVMYFSLYYPEEICFSYVVISSNTFSTSP